MLLHLVHEEVMSLLKVFTESTALLLRSVAGSIIDLFQNHPEFSSMLQDLGNVFLRQEIKFIKQRSLLEEIVWRAWVFVQRVSAQN